MDFAICKSGTSTLEYALLGVPMVIIYRASYLTGLIARRVLKIPHIGLVNIVAGKEVAPELLQEQAAGPVIGKRVLDLLQSPDALDRMKQGLADVRQKMGEPGASKRAAAAIAAVLEHP
jgi:lipid-A-disaccharide synthase